MSNARHLRALQMRTLFVVDEAGRIAVVNDPGRRHRGPLLWLGGAAEGNVWAYGAGVGEAQVAALEPLLAAEPPFVSPDAPPASLALWREILGGGEAKIGLAWRLPHDLSAGSSARTVTSDAEEGRA
ncbi:MAG: hypothetical protein ACREQ5_31070, partial [Candidatus Dormibacteria bacterium]